MFPSADTEDISRVTSLARESSTSRDAVVSPENTQVSTQHNNRELTLNMLIKEFVFCIALALTTYGALHNTPSKISKHPQAVRFFSPDSVVKDWYRGQLSSALAVINKADISFVMYYAPWDAESQYVRGQFEKAANILHDRVHFAAINCWNPGSECRLQHNKIPSWPVLMAYTITSRGVLYKGPRDAHSMVNFIRLLMKPLERVSTTEDLVNLLSYCDAVAVGYTPVADTSRYYNIWYNVALKSREFDVIGEICFAAVTSEDLGGDLGFESLPNARLMLWNDTKDYMTGESDVNLWNESSVMQWVLENFSQPVSRVIPMWKKAFSFERYVDGNPILMLFTPLNPLYEQIPSYSLLREVAMEYYNCKNNDSIQWTSELIKLQHVQRLLYQQNNFTRFCQEFKFKKPTSKHSKYYKKEVEARNNKYPWYNTTQKPQKGNAFNFLFKRGIDLSKGEGSDDENQLLSPMGLLQECSTRVLPAEKSFYDHYEQCQTLEENFSNEQDIEYWERDAETTMLPFDDDPLSSENLIEDSIKQFCKLIKFANEWGPSAYPFKVDNNRNLTYIQGLACQNNFTLYMIAVDSVRNYHFAESLGIDITSKKDMTALVILDSKLESQYVLSQEYSARSVRDFIYNFTNKRVKRSLRTLVNDAAHTHYFGSEGPAEHITPNESIVDIIDLTTKTFKKAIKTPGVVTIVAVCGGGCNALISQAVARAVRLLRTCGVSARGTRLDALRHDLPWHYTVQHYPTIFVFSQRGGEADSVSYPAGARISASGIVSLALRLLRAPAHMRVRLALCATARANIEKKNCLRDIRDHITTVIGRNLKYWRQTEVRKLKDALFKRLQHLHQVSLKLSLINLSDLNENSERQKSLLSSFKVLAKNWDINVTSIHHNIDKESTS